MHTIIYKNSEENSPQSIESEQQKLYVTCYLATNPAHLSKEFSWVNSALVKKPAANMTSGSATRLHLTFAELWQLYDAGEPDMAFGYGIHDFRHPDSVDIVVSGKENPAKHCLARSKHYFRYHNGPGVICFDHDPSEQGKQCTPEQLLAILETIVPNFKGCSYIIKGSVSAQVGVNDTAPKLNAGFHLYVPVQNAADIPRFGKVLFDRLWLAGYGHIDFSKNGSLLVRSIIDGCVFSPERLDFTARPQLLSDELEYHHLPPVYHPGNFLDTTGLLDLSEAESLTLTATVEQAKRAAKPESDQRQQHWKVVKIQELVAHQVPMPAAQALVDDICHQGCKTLYGDFILIFDQLGAVSVRELFQHPARYDQQALADPVEGVGYGKTTAKFYWNNGRAPYINSFAHGGQKYNLMEDATIHQLEEDRHGKFKATLSNLNIALSDPDICEVDVAYDEFRGCELIRRPSIQDDWQPLSDFDCTDIAITLAKKKRFADVSPPKVSIAISHYAMQHKIDTAIDWVNDLVWDGIPRVETFLARYFGAEDCPYATAVSQYLWTALVGRLLVPGIQADMVPILYGAQGGYKSTGLAAMVPYEDAFCEVNLAERDDNLSRRMVGVMIGELSELRGLKTKDAESIKEFLTRKHEKWVPKYRERPILYPRRSLFIGTTNEDQFLADTTGNRRFLPITVTRADRNAIERDRSQLWAEAAVMFRNIGILYKDAEELAKQEHEKYQMLDVWENVIVQALGTHPQKILMTGITTADILEKYLEIPLSRQNYQSQNRVKGIMKKLGYNQHRTRVDGLRAYRWYPAGVELAA